MRSLPFIARLRRMYADPDPASPRDYRVSRTLFLFQSVTAFTVFFITSGAFFSGYAVRLGMKTEMIGLLYSVRSILLAVQLASPLIFERMRHRKWLIVLQASLARFSLGLLFLLPSAAASPPLRIALFVGIFSLSAVSSSLCTPAYSHWVVSLTDPETRGRYLGLKDTLSFSIPTAITFMMGLAADAFRRQGNEPAGYLMAGLVTLALAVADLVIMSNIKEPANPVPARSVRLREIVTAPLREKRFRKVIVIFVLWHLAMDMASNYSSVYMVGTLRLDYSYMTAVGALFSVGASLTARYWGRLADRTSWWLVEMIGVFLQFSSGFLWLFVNPGTYKFLIPLGTALAGLGWSALSIPLFNFQFMYSPPEGRTIYLSFNAVVSGIFALAGAGLGSLVIRLLEDFRGSLAGMPVVNVNIVFLISSGMYGIMLLYTFFMFRPEPRKRQDKGA